MYNMIISHKYKFVFIHIQKNAGTFTTNLILKLDPNAINMIDANGYGHQTYKEICEIAIFNVIKNYSFFSIIRNPIDQTISFYNFTKNIIEINNNREFNEWIKDDINIQKNSLFILDKNNKIPSNFTLIDFDNLQAGLTPFFINLGISKVKLQETSSLYQLSINESKKYIIKNNDFIYNDIISTLLNNKNLCYELLFYNTVTKQKKQFNFNI
jgi:hypothetical protein